MQPALTVPTEKTVGKRRKRLPLSFLLAAIAICGALIYLVYTNTQASAVYYMTVPELKQCASCQGQTVRVAGYVKEGTIQRNDQNNTISFIIEDGKQSMSVVYSGVVPDIFKAGVQVVVEGRYTGTGPFQAQVLNAKCPSKFQSLTPTPPTENK